MLRTAAAIAILLLACPAMATEAGWALLREGGHVVLLRHAYALGAIDPPNFDIEKCATQRNLSDRGKQQARKIGSLFAARAAPVDDVLSSRLCRAYDTATIAFGERNVEKLEALDPPTADTEAAGRAKAEVLALIAAHSGSGNLVMVADVAMIEALTGAASREGEALIVTPSPNGLHILGRIVF